MFLPVRGLASHTMTSRLGSRKGIGRSNTALTTLKIAVFAPPSENDTTSYAAGIAAKVGENANPHDVAVRKALCQAIAHWEDYQAQWPVAEIDSGMMLCDARWPGFLAALNGPARCRPAPGETIGIV